MQTPQADWKWFGNAGHLIVGQWCRFHLCTWIGGYLVSTVGEYWPDRVSREIHAQVYDPVWLSNNKHLKGDAFDHAYMERFGYENIGSGEDSKYETMIFKAGAPCQAPECDCGMPVPTEWSELYGRRFRTARQATEGHMKACSLAAHNKVDTQ